MLTGLAGIWRWLGRQRAYEDGGASAKEAIRRSSSSALFTATGLGTMPVIDGMGAPLGRTVEALVACESGEVAYIVIATGGVGGIDETLRAVAREDVRFGCERLQLSLSNEQFLRLPPLEPGDWPAQVPPRG